MLPTTHTEAGQSCGALTAAQELVLVSLTLQIAHRRAHRQPVRRCSCITLRKLAGEADPSGFVQLQGSAGRLADPSHGWPREVRVLAASCPALPRRSRVPGALLRRRTPGPRQERGRARRPSSGRPPAPRRPRPRLLAPRSPAPSSPRRLGGRQRAVEPRRARGGDGRCPQRCAAGPGRCLARAWSFGALHPARPRPAAVGSAGLGRLRGTAGPERSRAGSPRPLSRARGRPEERCAAQCSPVPSLTKAPLCWPRNC